MADTPIKIDGAADGRLCLEKEGNIMRIYASCSGEEGFIYRLYLTGPSPCEDTYLGIMMPEGRRFVLRKDIPLSKWQENPDSDHRAYVIKSFPGESGYAHPLPFQFGIFGRIDKNSVEGIAETDRLFSECGGMRAFYDGKWYYCAEASGSRELPCTKYFCMFSYVRWGNKGYWVLCVDQKGEPRYIE